MPTAPIRFDLLQLLAARTIELAKADLVADQSMPVLVYWNRDGSRRLVRIDTCVNGAPVLRFLPLLAEHRPTTFLMCWIRPDDALCVLIVHPEATKLGAVPFRRNAFEQVCAFDDLAWTTDSQVHHEPASDT